MTLLVISLLPVRCRCSAYFNCSNNIKLVQNVGVPSFSILLFLALDRAIYVRFPFHTYAVGINVIVLVTVSLQFIRMGPTRVVGVRACVHVRV